MKPPDVVGLILCEKMAVDTAPLSLNLVGLFQLMRFKKFPASPPFAVYSALYDGEGEGTMELRGMHMETEKDVYSYKRWLAFPGRQTWVNMHIPVTKCVFPDPGRYRFSLLFENEELAYRYIDVLLE